MLISDTGRDKSNVKQKNKMGREQKKTPKKLSKKTPNKNPNKTKPNKRKTKNPPQKQNKASTLKSEYLRHVVLSPKGLLFSSELFRNYILLVLNYKMHSFSLELPSQEPACHSEYFWCRVLKNLFFFPGSQKTQLLFTSNIFIGLFGTCHFIF